jgi:hypothetical protein
MPILGSLAGAAAKGYGLFSGGAGPEGGASARAITGMGDASGSLTSNMEYFNITTAGNASSFGNLNQSARHGWATASTTRALLGGGVISGNNNSSVIDYVTIATTGNATSFGTSYASRPRCMNAGGNTTRSVIAGAGFQDGSQSVNIEYHTFATTGNGTFFGDLISRRQYAAGGSSPTRTVFAAGYQTSPSTAVLSSIEYITTATTGNATSFGSLTVALESRGSGANSTRCLFTGGYGLTGPQVAVVEYITIASTGNGTDYGDLSVTRSSSMGTANDVRFVLAGGYTSSDTYSNVIDFIKIADGGNATDFGDLITARSGNVTTSAGHGGLQ